MTTMLTGANAKRAVRKWKAGECGRCGHAMVTNRFCPVSEVWCANCSELYRKHLASSQAAEVKRRRRRALMLFAGKAKR